MNYSGIIYNDIANGPGVRTSLFVSGCRNHCVGCFNQEQQNFSYGKEFTDDVANEIIKSIDNSFTSGISILGGDPMEPENAEGLNIFLQEIHNKFINKTVWMYTGYLYENLIQLDINDYRRKNLEFIDVLVDGPFILDLKNISLKFRGSSNQRIIDVKKSIKNNIVCLYE